MLIAGEYERKKAIGRDDFASNGILSSDEEEVGPLW
jgi:hypothetical protein